MTTQRTAAQTARAVRSGELTARRAVEAALARLDALDGRIHAFQEVRTFKALREADEVDARADRADLPLAGVPIAIKDNVQVAGEPMRVGSTATSDQPQPADHEVVRRLRAAGAVVVGITRLPELGIFGTTESPFGITRNPWDLARTPGGSSGGSAAAVAAGIVPVAHANDGMGSIRIPGGCCGLVGIKPGSGRVPAGLGNGSWFGMAENGPLATTVEDAALVLAVLADEPRLAELAEPAALRIATSTRSPMIATPVDRHWAAVVAETADLLTGAGHAVAKADPPYGQVLIRAGLPRWMAGAELDAREVEFPERLMARSRRHAAVGRAVLRLGMPRAKGRDGWLARADKFFAERDVLITPTLAQPPLPAKPWHERGWLVNMLSDARYAPFAAPWNLAGWPAMTVPAGLAPNGMPLGVQLVGPPGSEARLLGLAAQLERLRPWPRHAPIAS